jgi:fermentation-respiration switch protein FrsA (DUF1100 family)
MRLRTLLAFSVALLLVAGLGGWAWRQSRQAIADKDRTIAALRQQLDEARQAAVSHREQLRRHALDETVRTPDEFLALFPAKYPQGDWRPAEALFEDCWFRAADGLRLHGWLLHHDQPRHVLLYVHGNAGNVTHRAAAAQHLSERYQASVFVFDYRGYGRSEGTPTIPGLLDDARAARAYLAEREGVAERDVILLGESLGGAIAVDLAAGDGARALILQSTFSSLREVAAAHYPAILVDTLVANRLDSAAQIANYRGPLLQVHGEADRTIPIALGRELFDAANEPKTFVALPGHDHNDSLPSHYWGELEAMLQRLEP